MMKKPRTCSWIVYDGCVQTFIIYVGTPVVLLGIDPFGGSQEVSRVRACLECAFVGVFWVATFPVFLSIALVRVMTAPIVFVYERSVASSK